jgi:hypothetical protein
MIYRPALMAAASRMMRWGELDDGGAMAVDVVDDNRRASTPGHRSAGRRTRLPARTRSIGSTLSKILVDDLSRQVRAQLDKPVLERTPS